MSKQASRIFQEMPLIERLLHQSISEYDPTQDDAIDETMKELLHREVPERADSFVTSLYAIAQDMTFSDWQEFWLDMGIRIYNAEEDFKDYELNELFPTADCADDADELEDDNGLDGFNGLYPTTDCADDADELEDNNGLDGFNGLFSTTDYADYTDESND